ncbi:hypothetical protein GM921_15170 [Pedobacter sp. LMG 31464]|uniref:Outer membrane protein beta-barrel domain-containing protein n=1 Tax=Pedobacter planticolens TaxID=2679964 RepID=A0A923E1U6_9SPHI|nr:hypothetical protein [Pedobacter planticolens]MBB2146843.1 hypothetical protein [Pedobacter planticolens]
MRNVLFALLLVYGNVLFAQDTTKIALTTGVGIISMPGALSKVLKSSVTFNSGIELKLKKNWFLQGDVSLNSIGYNQIIRDNPNNYLFEDANSSLFQVGVSGGYSFRFLPSKFSLDLYAGPGFQRFGEPRVTNNNAAQITKQNIVFSNTVFAKIGSRLSYKTNSSLLQTIYIEATYFTSPLHVQAYRLQGFTYCVGTKFSLM